MFYLDGSFSEVELLGLIYDIKYYSEIADENIQYTDYILQLISMCYSGIRQLNFNPDLLMDEVLKHIESRTGSINEDGKWQKDSDITPYKVNFESCRITKEN